MSAAPEPTGIPSWKQGLRALPAMLRVGLLEMVAYRAEFLVWTLTTNMPLVMLAVWHAVAREAPVGHWSTASFTAYYLCTMVVRLITNNWVFWEINMDVRNGTLVTRLLRPVSPLLMYGAQQAAAVPMRVLVVSPVLLAAWVWSSGALAQEGWRWASWPLVLAGSWLLQFNVMVFLGLCALYVDSAEGLFEVWIAVGSVLGGYLVPVDLFPTWLAEIARVLPFSLTQSLPVEWVTGTTAPDVLWARAAQQWAYVLGSALAVLWIWTRALKRFAAFGG